MILPVQVVLTGKVRPRTLHFIDYAELKFEIIKIIFTLYYKFLGKLHKKLVFVQQKVAVLMSQPKQDTILKRVLKLVTPPVKVFEAPVIWV
jgi:hypothetical protein